ncbi:porin family protein [Prevotella sp. 10(H)]|uniref:porin family protein n=1 Tax=Prevotella sp. 10(H) TaxID=1158294 RepID=UPI0004A740C1|nr:porin family protein [Prevotella sp. 10(H)]
MNKIGFIWVLVIALVLLLQTGFNANAQTPPVTIGIKGGINLSDFGGDIKDMKSAIKYQAGITFDIALTENVYVLTGLEFVTKGAKHKPKKGAQTRYNPIYLQIPVHAAYKFDVASDVKLVINAGPYAAYGLGGKMKTDGEKVNIFGDNRFKRFDFGIGGGAGVEVGKIAFNLGYDFGLLNINDMKGVKVRNRNAYASLGLKF